MNVYLFFNQVAPLKALCSEKFKDWKNKFEYLNIKCIELTGDTDHENENDLNFIENSNIICTTPVTLNFFFNSKIRLGVLSKVISIYYFSYVRFKK